jgi:Family of unknown function (DUF6220)
MRTFAGAAYRWLIAIFVLCVLVQFLLAGAGVFGEDRGAGALKLEDEKSWDPHRAFGVVLFLLAILVLVACLAWWSERIWLLGTFLLALLTFVQFPLASAGEDHRWIGALHPLNAGLILLLAGWLGYRAWRRDLRSERGSAA